MKNLFTLIFIFMMLSFGLSSQNNSLKPSDLITKAAKSNQTENFTLFNLSSDRNKGNIPKEIKSYTLLNINKSQVKAITETSSKFISLSIPQEGRNDLTLELVEVNPFASDFKVKLAPSMQEVQVETGKHYRGIVKGQKMSIAAVSVINGEIIGFVSHPMATGNLIIGKLENDDRHILY